MDSFNGWVVVAIAAVPFIISAVVALSTPSRLDREIAGMRLAHLRDQQSRRE